MKNKQKGAGGLAALIVLVILIAIIGYFWKRNPTNTYTDNTNTGTTNNDYTPINTGTSGGTNPGSTAGVTNTPTGGATGSTTVTQNASGSVTYRLPEGLTLKFPQSWAPYAITKPSGSYGGVTPVDTSTITLPDGPVLRVNVFTKEQWNSIKTQENAANQNTASLGEGEYLGENSTYIYSFTILGHEAEARNVLRNIISF